MKSKNFIKEYGFIFVIIAVLIFSVMYPALGLKVKAAGLLDVLTFIAMFCSSLGLSLKKLTGGFKDYKSILYSFAAVFFIFPLIAWLILFITGFREGDVYAGVMILSSQSSTVSSGVVLTMAAAGNVPLALIITIINNIGSAFVTPAVLRVIFSTDQQIAFNLAEMILDLVIVLIVPVVLAQIVRLFVEKWLKYINPVRKFLGQFVIVMFVLTGGASASSQLTSNISLVFIVVILVVVIHSIMLTLAALFCKLTKTDKETQISVMYNSSQKTLPASILVWVNYFSQYAFAPIVFVAYHMCQLIIGSIIGSKFKKLIEESHIKETEESHK